MDISHLKELELFSGLPDADLQLIANRFHYLETLAGSGFAREGDFGYKFFVVLNGEVDVLRDFRPVARLGPGEFFGEMALVNGRRRNARVVAHTRCSLAWMMSWDFQEMAQSFPQIAQRIDAAVQTRVAQIAEPSE